MGGAWSSPADRHIPMDIIEEILLNLPVKSLVRFRCVSRFWNSTITEPSFGRSHFFALRKRGRPPQLVVCHGALRYKADDSTLISISNHDSVVESTARVFSPFDGDADVSMLASCEELWCVRFAEGRRMLLWNPTMRTYKEIPTPPTVFTNCGCTCTGMGYDPVRDDFKLLKVPCSHEDSKARWPGGDDTVLYSWRNDAWSKIAHFPGGSEYKPSDDAGALVCGALHWIIYPVVHEEPHMHRPYGIVSFNMSSHEYGEVAQPAYYPVPEVFDSVHLTVLNGMLSAYLQQYGSGNLIVWCMKDYGEGKSWTKSYHIECDGIPFKTRRIRRLTPLCVYEDGRILIGLNCTKEIVIYKHEENSVVSIVVGHKFYDAVMHTQTLISPAAIWPPITDLTGFPISSPVSFTVPI